MRGAVLAAAIGYPPCGGALHKSALPGTAAWQGSPTLRLRPAAQQLARSSAQALPHASQVRSKPVRVSARAVVPGFAHVTAHTRPISLMLVVVLVVVLMPMQVRLPAQLELATPGVPTQRPACPQDRCRLVQVARTGYTRRTHIASQLLEHVYTLAEHVAVLHARIAVLVGRGRGRQGLQFAGHLPRHGHGVRAQGSCGAKRAGLSAADLAAFTAVTAAVLCERPGPWDAPRLRSLWFLVSCPSCVLRVLPTTGGAVRRASHLVWGMVLHGRT